MLRTRCLHTSLRHHAGDLVLSRWSSFQWRRSLLTLAIESSCDDTSVAVLEKHGDSNRATLHFHEKVTANNSEFRGINPKTALTSHQQSLAPLIHRGLAHLPLSQDGNGIVTKTGTKPLDFISVTRGPGMRSSVSTGLDTAKGLAVALGIPVVGVNHMQAHALTPRLVSALDGKSSKPDPEFPFMSLLVSGGHTMVLSSESLSSHRILADTTDVAVGDALDKMARMILPEDVLRGSQDVSYARVLEQFVFGDAQSHSYSPPRTRADEVTPKQSPWGWTLPIPLAQTRGGKKTTAMQMSFSGLVSAVERLVQSKGFDMSVEERRHLGFESMRITFEHVASRVLLGLSAMEDDSNGIHELSQSVPHKVSSLVASGGVAANQFLRRLLRSMLDSKGYSHVELHFPPQEFCTDNAAMIAWAGIEMFEDGWESQMSCLPLRKWSLDPNAEDGGIFGVGGWKQRS